jgi:hypothetical protein
VGPENRPRDRFGKIHKKHPDEQGACGYCVQGNSEARCVIAKDSSRHQGFYGFADCRKQGIGHP